MKLPVVAGKDAILVVYDRLSKMAHFVATIEATSAEELARLFRDNIWKLHGLPESVVLDRGPQFVATNGWADGTNEPRVGAILEVLCRSPAKRLAGAFNRGRVCSE